MSSRCASLIALFALLLAAPATAAPHRRAVIVGINDYSASKIGGWNKAAAAPGRDWPSLRAAVNDAEAIRDVLVTLYGFDAADIVLLRNAEATRAAILGNLDERLVRDAAKNDTLLFYYAGHGSQVRNSRSDEPDQLDESLVPADSRAGAPDIRDKELRPLFNRILDRGARLTVILDNCSSGSGARGLFSEAQPRGVKPDRRDVADARRYGPRPESRGALVLAAAQDDGAAWETNEAGVLHGTFTWAWLHALRDAATGESAGETFLRAQARMRAARPFQQPVLAGTTAARSAPFLGERLDRRGDRTAVAVEKVERDGTVVLQGGWANGLSIGSTLRLIGGPATTAPLTITAMRGVARSEARAAAGQTLSPSIRSGVLLEPVGWIAPPAQALRVSIPVANQSGEELARVAGSMARAAAKRGLHWLADPTESTPSAVASVEDRRPRLSPRRGYTGQARAPVLHRGKGARLLRPSSRGWELVNDGEATFIGDDAAAIAAIGKLPRHSSLFVQFPVPSPIAGSLDLDGVEDADYILAGRFTAGQLTYAWVRPFVTRDDRHHSVLPPRSDWTASAAALRDAALRLQKIYGWQTLESPPGAGFPYRLALRRPPDRALIRDNILHGGERYDVLLLRDPSSPREVARRFVYLFAIDSDGRSLLLYPAHDGGSVENRIPAGGTSAGAEVRLATIAIDEPYGIDTYCLLTTDEPLPDPWILTWEGVRSRAASGRTPSAWSIEKVLFESVPPARSASVQPRRK
jgi:uncharacterized caspase-like protein